MAHNEEKSNLGRLLPGLRNCWEGDGAGRRLLQLRHEGMQLVENDEDEDGNGKGGEYPTITRVPTRAG